MSGGEDGSTAWLVPSVVEADGDVVTVSRAWPPPAGDGQVRVTVEGRDRHGRLRAGTVERGGGVVRLLPTGLDPRLPGLEPLAPESELVVHRAGRRAVLRHTGGYTKVVRPGRSGGVAAAAATGRALAGAAGLDAPEVVRHDPGTATVTMSVLPGRPVHELSAGPDWERIWTTWSAAWVRLQGLAPDRLPLAPHTAQHEAGVVQRWTERAQAVGVLPAVWARRAAAARTALETAGEPDRLVPAHRDLHDKQLLWDGAALGVLDLDTACLADPALDPANLAVHASLRHAQDLWTSPAAHAVELSAALVARVAGVGDERWRAARLATVARLACVYAFRPAWRDVVLPWADRTWEELAA